MPIFSHHCIRFQTIFILRFSLFHAIICLIWQIFIDDFIFHSFYFEAPLIIKISYWTITNSRAKFQEHTTSRVLFSFDIRCAIFIHLLRTLELTLKAYTNTHSDRVVHYTAILSNGLFSIAIISSFAFSFLFFIWQFGDCILTQLKLQRLSLHVFRGPFIIWTEASSIQTHLCFVYITSLRFFGPYVTTSKVHSIQAYSDFFRDSRHCHFISTQYPMESISITTKQELEYICTHCIFYGPTSNFNCFFGKNYEHVDFNALGYFPSQVNLTRWLSCQRWRADFSKETFDMVLVVVNCHLHLFQDFNYEFVKVLNSFSLCLLHIFITHQTFFI